MTRRRLPLVSLPKLTVPLFSARIAGSFGLRASNRSATRGRPPVMSRVFEDSCGMRAMTSPTDTFAPSSRLTRRARGQRVHRRNLGVRERDFLALGIDELHRRTQVLAAALLGVEHHGAREARDFVQLRGDREAVHEVLELDHARPPR